MLTETKQLANEIYIHFKGIFEESGNIDIFLDLDIPKNGFLDFSSLSNSFFVKCPLKSTLLI